MWDTPQEMANRLDSDFAPLFIHGSVYVQIDETSTLVVELRHFLYHLNCYTV
jgi:hypothetical protein